jgi:predicted transcriptional regulator
MYNDSGIIVFSITFIDEIQNLGSIVKHQRNRLGFTLMELATKSGVSPSHIARIEKGERYT